MTKVLLTGYYGFGNLGDDLLFLCNYRLIRKLIPHSEIDVLTEASRPQYLSKLAGKELKFLNWSAKGSYDIVWHGGGGVFFDFKKGGTASLILNKFIKLLGPHLFTKIYKWARKNLGKPAIDFGYRVGVGIGVGTFTSSSYVYKYKIPTLSSFNYLVVRDEQSRKNVFKLIKGIDVAVSTDIVFDTGLWLEDAARQPKKNESGKKIGIILRDWSLGRGYNYFDDIYSLTEDLQKQGYHITFFSFDAETDRKYMTCFSKKEIPVLTWSPETMEVTYFVSLLAQQNYLITSRFHAAIIGSCLGIPGIVVNIEPKLKTASEMLKGCYFLLDLPLKEEEVTKAKEFLINNGDKSVLCAERVSNNKKMLLQSEKQLDSKINLFLSREAKN